MKLFVLFALIASCSAFAPAASVRPAVARRSAMPVRQVAPLMELETVDTWCADALIMPPEPRPDARDSQRSTQAGSEASVALTPLLPASTGGETRTTRTRSCSASARTSRPRCSASPPALRSASASTASRRATCSTFSAAARCLPPPLPSLAAAESAPGARSHCRAPSPQRQRLSAALLTSRLGFARRSTASTSRALCWCRTRGACTWRAGSSSRTASERGAQPAESLCGIMRPSSAQPVCSGPWRSERARSLLRRLLLSLSPLCSGRRWPRSRVNVLS